MFCTDAIMFDCYTDKIKEDVWCKCKKCNDSFKLGWGGCSEKAGCRYHNGDRQCLDCYLTLPSNSNCYHIKRTWWDFLFKWCS